MAKILTWRDDWTLSIDTLDEDHRGIVDLLLAIASRFADEPQSADKSGIGEGVAAVDGDEDLYQALDRLGAFTRQHFKREEEFMRTIDYPGLAKHRSEHALLMAEHTALVREFGKREQAWIAAIADGNGSESAFELTRLMQETMTDKGGIFRHGDRLREAVDTLCELQARSRNLGLRRQARGANPELVAAYRLQRMLKLAQCVAYGALQRTESRGAHFRADHPRRDDLNWLSRTLATWPGADADLPQLDYEALDIMRMEIPPGWRGYGARDYIEHPDTARRQAQIDAELGGLQDADRHARQEAVMPFRHLLPEHLRGNNRRLGED